MENGKVSKELVAQILNIDNVEELVEQIAVNIKTIYLLICEINRKAGTQRNNFFYGKIRHSFSSRLCFSR